MKSTSFELRVSSCELEKRSLAAASFKAFDPKLETRNSKLSVINSKPETRNPKLSSKLAAAVLPLAVVLTAWPLSSDAQAMNDPTRPPESVLSTVPGSEEQVGAPLLQSVMLSRTERSAIIGGELVKLGGKYRDARVISITETEVVLRSAHGIETLRLYPKIEMKPVKPATAAAAPKAARKPAAESTQPRGDRQ